VAWDGAPAIASGSVAGRRRASIRRLAAACAGSEASGFQVTIAGFATH